MAPAAGDAHEVGFYLAFLISGMGLGSMLASRLNRRFATRRLLMSANGITVLAAIGFTLVAWLGLLSVDWVLCTMFVFVAGASRARRDSASHYRETTKLSLRVSKVLQLGVAAAFATVIGTASSAWAADPIRIGAVLPFSGGVELYGNQAKLGLDLAAKEINARGGILGRPVEILYEDDRTNPDAAIAATRKLVETNGVLAVVGPITSRNLDAMVPVLDTLKTPLLYATNYEGGKCGRYVFSFSTVPNQELAQLLPYMGKTFGNTLFLLGADRAWPRNMFNAAEPIIARMGGRVVGKEFTNGTEKDFGTVGRNHHATMNMFLARTKGKNLVTVRALGEIAPDPGCK